MGRNEGKIILIEIWEFANLAENNLNSGLLVIGFLLQTFLLKHHEEKGRESVRKRENINERKKYDETKEL